MDDGLADAGSDRVGSVDVVGSMTEAEAEFFRVLPVFWNFRQEPGCATPPERSAELFVGHLFVSFSFAPEFRNLFGVDDQEDALFPVLPPDQFFPGSPTSGGVIVVLKKFTDEFPQVVTFPGMLFSPSS